LLLSVRDFTRSYIYLSRKVMSNMYFCLSLHSHAWLFALGSI